MGTGGGGAAYLEAGLLESESRAGVGLFQVEKGKLACLLLRNKEGLPFGTANDRPYLGNLKVQIPITETTALGITALCAQDTHLWGPLTQAHTCRTHVAVADRPSFSSTSIRQCAGASPALVTPVEKHICQMNECLIPLGADIL